MYTALGNTQYDPCQLGLVADSVIQVIERLEFEDGLSTGTNVEVITDSHSVRTNPEASVRL